MYDKMKMETNAPDLNTARKELIYIVSKKSDRDSIMKSIMEKAGAHTETKAMVFSLPVDSVVGLRSVTETEEE